MAQSLELLLMQFLMSDNDARRKAEEQIKKLAKDPQVVPALLHHLRTAKTPGVRQLSAVLLRKKITGHWHNLAPSVKAMAMQSLLESITMEHSSPVRLASANAVSTISKYAIPEGEWPELFPFLFKCSQSPQEEHREVAFVLFSSVAEMVGIVFKPYLQDLQAILLKTLNDETSKCVKVAALKAVGSFLDFVNDRDEVVIFRQFIPPILNVAKQSLAVGEEDTAIIAFEIFDDLIESPAPLLGDSIKSIVQFSLEVFSNHSLALNTRYQAIQIISWLAKYKSVALKKHGLVVPVLQVMCPSLAETSSIDDDYDLSADHAAAEVIDTLSLKLPKQVFPTIFEFASLSNQDVNPKFREASATALGVVTEGCAELMRDKLEAVLNLVFCAFSDPEQMVRGAASFALGQFAEHLQPDIISHHEKILPCILNSLDNGSEEVKEKSCYALAAFCENMGEEITSFVDTLMWKLLSALPNSPRGLQETCMSAIGSVASAAEQAFIPYAERVLELMKPFMLLTEDEGLRLRARATELVGIVAMSLGRTRTEMFISSFMEAAIAGFKLDFSELREYTHGFFSNISEIMGDGFAQFLPHIVPLVFYSCNIDDGSAVEIDESDDDNISQFSGDLSDDEDDVPRVRNISIRTGLLDEKAAATQAIGLLALHAKSSYEFYLEDSMKILERLSNYFHEDVRLQTMISLKHILTAVHAASLNRNEGPTKARAALDMVMNIYIKCIVDDDDKEVVAEACLSIASIIEDYGYAAIEPYLSEIVKAALLLLKEESNCQQSDDDDDDNDDDIDDQCNVHDELLMEALSDLLPALAKAMGSCFSPILEQLFEPLMGFAKRSRPSQDRAMVVACLAEIAKPLGAPIAGYIDRVMPFVLRELSSSMATNRRNAAFCVGELCFNGKDSTLRYYEDILRGLHPLFGDCETDGAVVDNAAGALAKMIMAHPNSIPLNQVLPALLKVLPLKQDREESMPVYTCLSSLVSSSCPEVFLHAGELLNVCALVVTSPLETDEVKSQVGSTFSRLVALCGPQIQPLLANLLPHAASLLALFSSKTPS